MGTDDDSMTSTFLDVDVFINDNKFGTKVYDKSKRFQLWSTVVSFQCNDERVLMILLGACPK